MTGQAYTTPAEMAAQLGPFPGFADNRDSMLRVIANHRRAAYDAIVQAMGGIMSITGEEGGAPVRVGASIADLTAALCTLVGILGALHHRERTGEGQLVGGDLSLSQKSRV